MSKSDTASIKGVAILLMLWHHLFLNATGYGVLTHSVAVFAKVCVALFLFVSGYGLTKQYDGLARHTAKDTIKLLGRRYVNFFLQYWFCFILVVLVGNICGYSFSDAYPPTRNTLKCFILDGFGQMGYNSYLKPWWFNKMIIQLYLVFPILLLIICNKYTACIGLFAIIPLQLFAKSIPGNIFFLIEGGLPAFYLGMVSARYRIIPPIRQKAWKIVLTSIFVLLTIGLIVLHHYVVTKDAYQAILIRALIALCFVCAYKSLEGCHTPLPGFIGKYATIMYFTHVLFLILIPRIIYWPRYSILVFILFVIICLSAAMMIDRLKMITHFDNLRLAIVNQINQW